MNAATIQEAVRDGITRAIAVVGLAGIALIHVLNAPSTFDETPYLGWMYVALILGSVTVAAVLIHESNARAWAAAGGLALSVIVGYVLSRTTGLPQSSGDIGNWSEPLGIASLFVEGSVVAVSAVALLERVPIPRTAREAYAR